MLLNRRGWSNFLTCRSCGRVWGCPAVRRRARPAPGGGQAGRLVACHHCGHREHAPRRCECGSMSVARHGAGTERLQHDLGVALDDGDFPIFRLDADTSRARACRRVGVSERWSARCGRSAQPLRGRSAGVLIGTQMVAKGHDFPDVGLGVVLDADATLRFPDFRAEERTFALVASWPVVSGAETRDTCSCRRSPPRHARSCTQPPTTATASWPASCSDAVRSTIRPSQA